MFSESGQRFNWTVNCSDSEIIGCNIGERILINNTLWGKSREEKVERENGLKRVSEDCQD